MSGNRAATAEKLIRGTLVTIRDAGLQGTSARSVANRAGVNQALIFYHFGTMGELIEAASKDAVDASIARYRARLETAATLGDLLDIAGELRAHERAVGNVAVMAQVMAGAQHDAALARAARYAMTSWAARLEGALRRIVAGTALADLIDPGALARLVAAGIVGLELYEGVDPGAADRALDALRGLAALATVVIDAGPVARRAFDLAFRAAGRRKRRTP